MQAGIVYGYIGQVDYIVCHEEGIKQTLVIAPEDWLI